MSNGLQNRVRTFNKLQENPTNCGFKAKRNVLKTCSFEALVARRPYFFVGLPAIFRFLPFDEAPKPVGRKVPLWNGQASHRP